MTEETMLQEKVTSCRCHFCGSALCNVNVYSVDGEITKVLPDPTWPNSMARCVKMKSNGRAAIQYHYHPDRLNFPQKRAGERGEDRWERISWDQGLSEVAEKLLAIRDEFGAEAVAGLTGTAHYGDYTWVKTKFLNLFGSPNNHGNEAICHGPQTKAYETTIGWAGQIFMMPGVTNCLVLNSNQRESAPAGFAAIEGVKASGGKIISISPRFGNVSMLADYYLPIRPGSDGALYLAWLHVIINEELYDKDFVAKWTIGFDELKEYVQAWTPEKAAEITWIAADMIRETARVYATNQPSRIIAMQSYDGQAPNGFRTLRSVAMLEALIGSLDNGCPVVGPLDPTTYIDDYEAERNDMLSWEQQQKQIGGDRFSLIGFPGWTLIGEGQKRRYGTQMYAHWSNQGHAPSLWRQILSEKPYPVKALIITGCGALTKYSNTKLVLEAFKKVDLIVVADFFPNANTVMADYVFPMSDWMERPLMESYAGDMMGMLPCGTNAVEPKYERRSDYDFYRGLGIRCGQAEFWPEETLHENLDARLARSGKTFEEIATGPKVITEPMRPFNYTLPNPKTGKPNGFGTLSGKVELRSSVLDKLGFDPLVHYEEPNFSPYSTPEYAQKYPYILITGARIQPFYHSEFRQIQHLRELHPDPLVEINPITAQEITPPLVDGDWAWIETHMGKIKMKVRVTTAIAVGIISAEHNWWFPEDDPKAPSYYGAFKSNINVVLDDDPDICGQELGAYTNKNAMCTIYRA